MTSKTAPRVLHALLILCGLLVNGCGGSSKPSSDRPTGSSVAIASIDDAFSMMLNRKDRDDRYSATMYLKQHLGDEMVKHYGRLLFQLSNIPARLRVYESMGFFGGTATAALLAHYLGAEEEVEVKAQIISSLGDVGPDAAQFVNLIEDASATYRRLYETSRENGAVVVRSGSAEWMIRPDSMSPDNFGNVASKALTKIRGTGQPH